MGGTRPHPPLEGEASCEVVVIGGGVTGLTTAVVLAERGHDVVLLEARTLGSGASGGTTAHVTEALDVRYVELEQKVGVEGAALLGRAAREATEEVARLVDVHGIDCGFERLPGYLYTEDPTEREALEAEQQAAARAGATTSMASWVPLEFPTAAAVQFANQAQLNPGGYLRGLERAALKLKVRLHEQSRVVNVTEKDGCLVELENGARVHCKAVCVATHAPLNRVTLHLKLEHFMSYVIALEDRELPPGLYWDTATPYHYLRNVYLDGRKYVLVGGADQHAGTREPNSPQVDVLEDYVRARFERVKVSHRWSARFMEPIDGLPMIGRNALSSQVFVATGFSGNGFTHGTIAARLALEFVEGRQHPLAELVAPTRLRIDQAGPALAQAAFMTERAVGDRLRAAVRSLKDLGPGSGRVVQLRGEPVAVQRLADGTLKACSAVCTHLGCVVAFNDLERTWDCPCHGSRFGASGEVLEGPAIRPLPPRTIELEDEQRPSGGAEASK